MENIKIKSKNHLVDLIWSTLFLPTIIVLFSFSGSINASENKCEAVVNSTVLNSSANWQNLGLEGPDLWVYKLKIVDSYLFAATSSGLYRKSLNPDGTFVKIEFEGLKLEGDRKELFLKSLLFDQKNNKLFIADSASEKYGVIEVLNYNKHCSTNQSSCKMDWVALPEPNFGVSDDDMGMGMGPQMGFGDAPSEFKGRNSKITSLSLNRDGRLLAGGPRNALSIYNSEANVWEHFYGDGLEIHSIGAIAQGPDGVIVIGGQNLIEEPLLVFVSKDGEMLNLFGPGFPQTNGFPKSPSTVDEITLHPSGRLFLAMEGGLVVSDQPFSENPNWELKINVDNDLGVGEGGKRFIKSIHIDSNDPNTIYAVSWFKQYGDHESQKLFLYVSNDKGDTWKKIHGDENVQHGGLLSLEGTVDEKGKTVLYLGGFKGGVWKVNL